MTALTLTHAINNCSIAQWRLRHLTRGCFLTLKWTTNAFSNITCQLNSVDVLSCCMLILIMVYLLLTLIIIAIRIYYYLCHTLLPLILLLLCFGSTIHDYYTIQAKSRQVNTGQYKSTQVKTRPDKLRQVKASQLKPT